MAAMDLEQRAREQAEADQAAAEAATTVMDVPDFPGDTPEETGTPQEDIIIEGDGQLSLRVGGRKPDKATVKLRGGSIGVPEGAVEKGDALSLIVSCHVAEVHFVDKRQNGTGEIVEVERRHILRVDNVERLPAK